MSLPYFGAGGDTYEPPVGTSRVILYLDPYAIHDVGGNKAFDSNNIGFDTKILVQRFGLPDNQGVDLLALARANSGVIRDVEYLVN
jgi:hypothetical protein